MLFGKERRGAASEVSGPELGMTQLLSATAGFQEERAYESGEVGVARGVLIE